MLSARRARVRRAFGCLLRSLLSEIESRNEMRAPEDLLNSQPMAGSSNLSQSQYESLAAFRYALRQFLRFSEQAAKMAGVSPQQHQALLAIKGFPGGHQPRVRELAERLQLRHHSTVELVDRMARLKLVAREGSERDRREVFVRLTARGERVLEKLSSAHEEQLRRIGPELAALLKRLGTGE